MSDGTIDSDVIKRTQDTLGKYVKKPPLTEKLLKKPPFRFLFDIVGVIIRDTGCLEGLYSPDELNIENINDREKKMQFLQKLIDVIKIATNEPLTVKSSKIVAGHDPDKTNELLQQMGILIDKNLDWKSAVEAVNNGGSPPKAKSKSKEKEKEKEKESKEKKAADKPSPKDRDVKKTSKEKPKTEAKDKTKSNDVTVKKSSKSLEPEKKEKKAKSKSSSKDVKDAPKKTSPEKPSKSKSESLMKLESKAKSKEVKSVPSEAMERKAKSKEDAPSESVKTPPSNEPVHVEQVPQNPDSKPPTPGESSSPSTEYKRDKRRASKRAEEILLSAITEDSSVSEHRRSSGSKRSSAHSRKSSAEKSRQSAAEGNTVKTSLEPTESLKTVVEEPPPEPVPKIPKAPESDANVEVKRETTFVRENSKDITSNPPRPRTSLRPPSARPASARPGAPRRRDKNIEIILQPNDQVKLSGINVRLETFNSELEDDGENLVIIENPNTADPLLESKLDSDKVEADESLQQGHLVQQILETQKELVHGSSPDTEKLEKEYDAAQSTNRQSSARQMNSLRDLIQNLTKSVNPLGKLMDFIPEDIDAMQLELTMWRDTYTQSSIELKKERSLTESVTEPMKNQLVNIEATIKEYQEMIDACRVKILQNAEKIQRLLTSQ